MAFIKKPDKVVFADINLEKSFNSLVENSPLKKSIRKTINKLKENVFSGEQIKKELIPKEFIQKYKINNLWWFPLVDAWRLIYSIVTPTKFELLAVIIYYSDHKDYENIFGY
jgi:hypothetical protein